MAAAPRAPVCPSASLSLSVSAILPKDRTMLQCRRRPREPASRQPVNRKTRNCEMHLLISVAVFLLSDFHSASLQLRCRMLRCARARSRNA